MDLLKVHHIPDTHYRRTWLSRWKHALGTMAMAAGVLVICFGVAAVFIRLVPMLLAGPIHTLSGSHRQARSSS